MLDIELFTAYGTHDDQDAFRTLADRHLPLVYGIAQRKLHNRAVAEEVCQDVLCKLAQAAKQQQPILSVPAWLYRVTQHQTAQTMRSERRRQAREHEAASREHLERDGADSQDDLKAILREALALIPSKDRTLLFLRYYDDNSAADIGRSLGIPTRTAQKRVERAVNRLRAMVSRRGLTLQASTLSATLLTVDAMEPPTGFRTAAMTEQALQSAGTIPGSSALGIPAFLTSVWGILATSSLLVTAIALTLRQPDANQTARQTAPQLLSQHTPPRLAIDDIEGIYQLPEAEREVALKRLTVYLRDKQEPDYLSELFVRWTALDPPRNAATIAALLNHETTHPERQASLHHLLHIPLESWMATSPAEAQRWAREQPRKSEAERPAFETILQILAKQDIDTAYAWLIKRSYNRDSAYKILADALRDQAVPDVLVWLQKLETEEAKQLTHKGIHQDAGHTTSDLWNTVLTDLYTRDRQAVCAWLTELPSSTQTSHAIGTIVRLWAAEAPKEASDWATHLENVEERQHAQTAIAKAWGEQNLERALAWALDHSQETEDGRWKLATEAFRSGSASAGWGGNPDALRALLVPWSSEPAAASLHSILAEKLAPRDALAWSHTLSHPANQAAARQQAFYRFGQQAPEQGTRALTELLNPTDKAAAAHWLAMGWIVSGRKQAFDLWRKDLPDSSVEARAAEAAEIDLIATLRPELAAKRVLKLSKGPHRDTLLTKVIARTMQRSEAHANRALALTDHFSASDLKATWQNTIQQTKENLTPTNQLPTFKPFDFKEQPLDVLVAQLELLSKIPPIHANKP